MTATGVPTGTPVAVTVLPGRWKCGIKPTFIESYNFMKCVLCDQRKAKRFCPAKNALICPQCCGEKRVIEIDCPENCKYLKSGRERESRDYAKRVRSLGPEASEKNHRLLSEHQDVIAQLEYLLARERLSDRNLTDNNVVQAISVLLETYKTEDKGVLYEKTCEDLRVEALRRELRKSIESLRNPEGKEGRGIVDPQNTRLQLSAAIDCLEFVRSLAATNLEDRSSPSGYVDFLARFFPREEKRSSIVMP